MNDLRFKWLGRPVALAAGGRFLALSGPSIGTGATPAIARAGGGASVPARVLNMGL